MKPLVAAIVDLEDNGRHEVSNCGTKVSDENPSPTSQDVAKSSPKQGTSNKKKNQKRKRERLLKYLEFSCI